MRLNHEQSNTIHEWVNSFDYLADAVEHITEDNRYWILSTGNRFSDEAGDGRYSMVEQSQATGHFTDIYHYDTLLAALADLNACQAYEKMGASPALATANEIRRVVVAIRL